MRQRFERAAAGAVGFFAALLAAVIANSAQAGGVPSPDLDSGARASPCDTPGESCAHITGYIKAGSDLSARDPALRPAVPSRSLLAGFGSMGQSATDPPSRGTFFAPLSGDDFAR